MEIDILKEAKKEFGKEYGLKVKELGGHLSCGITKVDGSLGIVALVLKDNSSPDDLQSKIENLIPKNYFYKEYEIFVKVELRSPIYAQSS